MIGQGTLQLREFIENDYNRIHRSPIAEVDCSIFSVARKFALGSPPFGCDRYRENASPRLNHPIDTIEGDNK